MIEVHSPAPNGGEERGAGSRAGCLRPSLLLFWVKGGVWGLLVGGSKLRMEGRGVGLAEVPNDECSVWLYMSSYTAEYSVVVVC